MATVGWVSLPPCATALAALLLPLALAGRPGAAGDDRRGPLQVGNGTRYTLQVDVEWRADPLAREAVRETVGRVPPRGTDTLPNALRIGRNRVLVTVLLNERLAMPNPVVVREVFVSNPGPGQPLTIQAVRVVRGDLFARPPAGPYLKQFQGHREKLEAAAQAVDDLGAANGPTAAQRKAAGTRLLTEIEAFHRRLDEYRQSEDAHPHELAVVRDAMTVAELAKLRFLRLAGVRQAGFMPADLKAELAGESQTLRNALEGAMVRRLTDIGLAPLLTPDGRREGGRTIMDRARARIEAQAQREATDLQAEGLLDSLTARRVLMGRVHARLDQAVAGIRLTHNPGRLQVEWSQGTLLLWTGTELAGKVWGPDDSADRARDADRLLVQARQALEATIGSSRSSALASVAAWEPALDAMVATMEALYAAGKWEEVNQIEDRLIGAADAVWRVRQAVKEEEGIARDLGDRAKLLTRFEQELRAALGMTTVAQNPPPRDLPPPPPRRDPPQPPPPPRRDPPPVNPPPQPPPATTAKLDLAGGYGLLHDVTRQHLQGHDLTASGNLDALTFEYRRRLLPGQQIYRHLKGTAKWNGQTTMVAGKKQRGYTCRVSCLVRPEDGDFTLVLEEQGPYWRLVEIVFELWPRGRPIPPRADRAWFKYFTDPA